MVEPIHDDDVAEATAKLGVSIGGDDLPAQAADWIVDKVDTVKRATTDNAVITVRAVVYGLVVAALALTALVMVLITLVRVTDAYLPIGSGVGDATWAAYLFLGSLLTILGLGAWASRGGTESPTPLIGAAVVDVTIVVVIIVIGIIRGVS